MPRSTALSTKVSSPVSSGPSPEVRTRTGGGASRFARSAARLRSGMENSTKTGFTCSIVTSGSGAPAATRFPGSTRRRPVRPERGARMVQ